MENEAAFSVSVNGKEIDATPDNSWLMTYMGKLAMYNNIVVRVQDKPEMYAKLFRHQFPVDEVGDDMIANDYPVHMNLIEVDQHTLDCMDNAISAEASALEYGVPQEWLSE